MHLVRDKRVFHLQTMIYGRDGYKLPVCMPACVFVNAIISIRVSVSSYTDIYNYVLISIASILGNMTTEHTNLQ